jgi:S1-C subfamily serine protease
VLEDTIARAMPAVVKIETLKTRGSGFFIKPDLIVTNAHVVTGFLVSTVTTHSGVTLNGQVVQVSEQFDIALIQVPRPGTDAPLPLGHSDGLRLGQGTVALGWAETLTQSPVARGIVTGVRHDGDRVLIQTDAAPNFGDSGGPVLDRRGDVIGVTTFRADNGRSGYAVAIDDVKPLVERVTQHIITDLHGNPAVTVPAPRQSDTELRRSTGLQRYTSAVAAIASGATDLDAAWNRYKASCGITAVAAGQSHEWFELYDPQSELHRTTGRCAAALADVERRAESINGSLAAAAEAARRADVYPGTRRDILQAHRLDYPGWLR